jgi:HK97 family phage major capsid protein
MTNDHVEALFTERRHAVEEMQALLADTDGRDLSGEETQKMERLDAAIDGLDSRINSIIDRVERDKKADEARAKFEALRPTAAPAVETASGDADTLRALAKGEIRGAEFRALYAGGAAGASVVPTSFYSTLVEYFTENSGILAMGPTVLNTDSGENLQIPKQTTYSTASLVSETSAISASEPSFGRVTLGAYKFAHLIQVSSELLSDSGVDIIDFLARQSGVALANGAGAYFATGSGSGQPAGIATGATSVAAAGSAAITADDIIDLYHSPATAYRANGAFLMKDSTLKAVRKLKEGGSSGQYLWQPGLAAGQPDTLLGRPVYTDPNIAAIGTGNRIVVFGDPRAFFVRIAGGVQVSRSDDYAFNTDLVTWRFVLRADSAVVDANGLYVLRNT